MIFIPGKKRILWMLLCLNVHLLMIFLYKPTIALAISCEDVNNQLDHTKLFIDKSILLEDQSDRILHVFMSSLDPSKVFFTKEDYEYAKELFGFYEVADDTMKIDCTIIDNIAMVLSQRVQMAKEFVSTLSYDDVRPQATNKLEFFYEAGDYADDEEEAGERLLNLARRQAFFFEASQQLKKRGDKERFTLKSVNTYFASLSKFFSLERPEAKLYYYGTFIRSAIIAIDRDSSYLSEIDMRMINRHHQSSRLNAQSRPSTVNAPMNTFKFESSVGGLVIATRDWEEPYWRIASVHDSHNELALKSDLLRPGDMLVAFSPGPRSILTDLSYSQYMFDFMNSFTAEAKNVKKQTSVMTLRRGEGNEAEVRLVSFSQRGSGLPAEYGQVQFQASLREAAKQTEEKAVKEAKDVDISYVKLLVFPDNDHLYSTDFGSIKNVLRGFAEEKPQVIVVDLRFNNPLDNGHPSWESVREFLSAFVPPEVSLGFVRQRDQDGEEESYLMYSDAPDYLSEEDHERLQNTPLVVLTSHRSREYHEWVSHILSYHKRALLVGDASTASKDTVNSVVLGGSYVMSVPSIRLYTPGGKNFAVSPVMAHVPIPSFIPSKPTLELRYPENAYDDSLVEFDAEESVAAGDDSRDFVPTEWVNELVERSQSRIKRNPAFEIYQHIEQLVQLENIIHYRPKYMPMDISALTHQVSQHQTPHHPELGSTPKAYYLWGQSILRLDHTLVEALQVAADYGTLFAGSLLPEQDEWSMVPHPKFQPQSEGSNPKPAKHKGKAQRNSGGFN